MSNPDLSPSDDRVIERSAGLLPEEEAVGNDDPTATAEAILEESDARTLDRDAAPGHLVEHRNVEDLTDDA